MRNTGPEKNQPVARHVNSFTIHLVAHGGAGQKVGLDVTVPMGGLHDLGREDAHAEPTDGLGQRVEVPFVAWHALEQFF